MCDSQGNLLFYASSRDVYNKQHQIMANGGGIGFGTALAAFAMKQPGNQNIYYLFEYNYYNAPVGFMYSIIDMSLAAGMGSVTAKDVPICSGISCTRNFGASPHANGVDMWIVTHSATSNIFSAYLLTAAGLNTVAVTSACGYSYVINSPWKYINFSPNGRKCATSFLGAPGSGFTNTELYDFNRSTGVVSNALDLNHPGRVNAFSPDGTKFYTAGDDGYLVQYNLCAGTSSAIIASCDTVGILNNSLPHNTLQKGTDGKIYGSRAGFNYLSCIHSPNKPGIACNYVDSAIYLGGKTGGHLPSFFGVISPIFESTIDSLQCSANFTAPCLNAGNYTTLTWVFGDPLSGITNTSNVISPSHFFSNPGTYTVSLTMHGPQGSDTFTQSFNFQSAQPLIVSAPQNMCKGETTIVMASGASTYTWSSGELTASISISPTITTAYTVSATYTNSLCKAIKLFTVSIYPCTGSYEFDSQQAPEFSVFPNPTDASLYYTLNETVQHNYSLCDLSGRIILKGEDFANKGELDVKELEPGLYLFIITIRGLSKSLRIVVE